MGLFSLPGKTVEEDIESLIWNAETFLRYYKINPEKPLLYLLDFMKGCLEEAEKKANNEDNERKDSISN